MSRPVAEGESVLLIDDKGRHFLVKLDATRSFQYHLGKLEHREIIGRSEGESLASSAGGRLVLLRPRLADYILKMPRAAQVIYPKDLGPILMWADIGAGMTVLEAGTGSGALTMALLRTVGPAGRVISVERRSDHTETAVRAITRWLGEIPANLELRSGEVEEVLEEVAPERILLDLPEPWHAANVAADRQPGGGLLCSYLPTVPQVQTLAETLRETGRFSEIEVFETLHRTWTVAGRSVRPDHRMIGHTGFVVTARRVG